VENSQFRGRSRTSSHHSEVCILLFPKEQVEPSLEGTAPEPSLVGSGLSPVSLPLAGSPMEHRTAMPGGSIPDTNPYRKE
jgi:hypothetical protein